MIKVEKKLNFSISKYMILILLFLAITCPLIILCVCGYNLFSGSDISCELILFLYVSIIIFLLLSHAFDLRKRSIEIINNNGKKVILYKYFQSEAKVDSYDFSAIKKNIYFDYAKKIRVGLFFIKFYGISEKRNLLIPKVFDKLDSIVKIIKENSHIN